MGMAYKEIFKAMLDDINMFDFGKNPDSKEWMFTPGSQWGETGLWVLFPGYFTPQALDAFAESMQPPRRRTEGSGRQGHDGFLQTVSGKITIRNNTPAVLKYDYVNLANPNISFGRDIPKIDDNQTAFSSISFTYEVKNSLGAEFVIKANEWAVPDSAFLTQLLGIPLHTAVPGLNFKLRWRDSKWTVEPLTPAAGKRQVFGKVFFPETRNRGQIDIELVLEWPSAATPDYEAVKNNTIRYVDDLLFQDWKLVPNVLQLNDDYTPGSDNHGYKVSAWSNRFGYDSVRYPMWLAAYHACLGTDGPDHLGRMLGFLKGSMPDGLAPVDGWDAKTGMPASDTKSLAPALVAPLAVAARSIEGMEEYYQTLIERLSSYDLLQNKPAPQLGSTPYFNGALYLLGEAILSGGLCELSPAPVLTVAKAGDGAGTVVSEPKGIDCGPSCTSPFPADTKVTLKAIPDSSSTFAGWAGGDCRGKITCTVTMDKEKTVTATFLIEKSSFSILGAVKTADGKGLSGVKIDMTGGAQRDAETDDNGTYVFNDVAKGIYRLRPALEGYSFSPSVRSALVRNNDVKGMDFRALRTGITVKKPNGGEKWKSGERQKIEWSFVGDLGSTVKVELLKDGAVESVITRRTPIGVRGSGACLWRIPKDLPAGDKYQVRITSLSNSAVKDESDAFFSIGTELEADFQAWPTRGTSPLEVRFRDTSTGAITSRVWSFGDGASSSEQDPVHTYVQAGSYDVALTVTGPDGATSTRVERGFIEVKGPEAADLVVLNVTGHPVSLSGRFLKISGTVKNQGKLAAGKLTVGIFLSKDRTIDPAADIRIAAPVLDGLRPGEATERTITVEVPGDVERGVYYVGAVADVEDVVSESDESNNARASMLPVTILK